MFRDWNCAVSFPTCSSEFAQNYLIKNRCIVVDAVAFVVVAARVVVVVVVVVRSVVTVVVTLPIVSEY